MAAVGSLVCCRRLVSRFQKLVEVAATSLLSSLSASRLADALSNPPNMATKEGGRVGLKERGYMSSGSRGVVELRAEGCAGGQRSIRAVVIKGVRHDRVAWNQEGRTGAAESRVG